MIKEILLFIMITIAGAFIILALAKQPIVYFSVSQDKCVRVVGSDCGCDNLPDRYETIYIK